MVRTGELPTRLLALKYGADLVWGPETIDKSMIGTTRRKCPRTNTIFWTRKPNVHANSHPKTSPPPNPDATAEEASIMKESVLYRLHPTREKGKLIFQMGTSNPELAVEAARLVAGDVAGIDVNAGCPKPFSTSGGMGAALLKTPDLLCSILRALVEHIVPEYGIGISVKIRLLDTVEQTEALVTQLCSTGITGLTIHCRTTPMRPREKAIRDERLEAIKRVCKEAGVALLINGDVEGRDHAMQWVTEYGIDGAMIATCAEKNPSIFRSVLDGGKAGWRIVVREYLTEAISVENRWGNTKFMMGQLIPGKDAVKMVISGCRSHEQLVTVLGFEELIGQARALDKRYGLAPNTLLDRSMNCESSAASQSAFDSDFSRPRALAAA
jgi:tRNA-dihydrouridine synthase 2